MLFPLILHSCSQEPGHVQIQCFQSAEWLSGFCSLGIFFWMVSTWPYIAVGHQVNIETFQYKSSFLISFLSMPPTIIFYFYKKFLPGHLIHFHGLHFQLQVNGF